MICSETKRHVEFVVEVYTDWSMVNKHNGTSNINYMQRQ